jgi:hypothetical protein
MSTRTIVDHGEAPRARAAQAPRFARSGRMIDALRKDWLYSEKRPRDLLFTAIERLIRERPPMMVSQLGREAALLARHLSAEAGFAFENWDAAARAVIKTLLMAGALHSPDGHAIEFNIAAHAALVGGLADNYRDAAEAFLLQFLIGRLGDVTTRDHTALAHALFRQFDARVPIEELEDRVVILLARLADRVVLSGDVYELRLFASA